MHFILNKFIILFILFEFSDNIPFHSYLPSSKLLYFAIISNTIHTVYIFVSTNVCNSPRRISTIFLTLRSPIGLLSVSAVFSLTWLWGLPRFPRLSGCIFTGTRSCLSPYFNILKKRLLHILLNFMFSEGFLKNSLDSFSAFFKINVLI